MVGQVDGRQGRGELGAGLWRGGVGGELGVGGVFRRRVAGLLGGLVVWLVVRRHGVVVRRHVVVVRRHVVVVRRHVVLRWHVVVVRRHVVLLHVLLEMLLLHVLLLLGVLLLHVLLLLGVLHVLLLLLFSTSMGGRLLHFDGSNHLVHRRGGAFLDDTALLDDSLVQPRDVSAGVEQSGGSNGVAALLDNAIAATGLLVEQTGAVC